MARYAACGILTMPYQGFYIRTATWNALSYHNKILHSLRAVQAQHPKWVFCGPSAAGIYGYSTFLGLQRHVHAVAPTPKRVDSHGFVATHYLGPDIPVRTTHGLHVTDPLRTMFDCARMLDFENAMVVCSMGLRAIGKQRDDLLPLIEANPRKHGIRRARFVAQLAEPKYENGGEVSGLCAIVNLGFAIPEPQRSFTSPVSGRTLRPDYVWEREDGSIVAGELDGRQKYTNPAMMNGDDATEVIMNEKDRETELNLLHIEIVRFRMEHIRRPEQLHRLLEAADIPRNPNPPASPFIGFRPRFQ